jgi:hypothetical protein
MSEEKQLEVTPIAAFLANLIDILTNDGYRGVLQIAIAEHAVVGARMIHVDKDGKQIALDIPLEKLESNDLSEKINKMLLQ